MKAAAEVGMSEAVTGHTVFGEGRVTMRTGVSET